MKSPVSFHWEQFIKYLQFIFKQKTKNINFVVMIFITAMFESPLIGKQQKYITD